VNAPERRTCAGERHVEVDVCDVQDAIGHAHSISGVGTLPEEGFVGGLNRRPVLTAAQLFGALLLLVIASDSFTNAVEWFASLRGLARNAAGAIVAAIGSSLPETMVAVVALVVLHDARSQAVGIGAVLGAPFMLATVVFSVVGGIAFFRHSIYEKTGGFLAVEPRNAIVGLALFLLTFAFVVGASFAPTPVVRIGASIAVIVAYFVYLRYHLHQRESGVEQHPPPLRFSPRAAKPRMWIVMVQMAIALAATIVASDWFVSSVSGVSAMAGIPPLVVSLFLSPVATELPEAMNVILWMRRKEDELAFGNVIGAMMFQTSIASAIAMLASPWRLDSHGYAACAAAFAAVLLVLIATLIRHRLSSIALFACGIFYAAYLVFAAISH
jgi:cation:H+ antiporter